MADDEETLREIVKRLRVLHDGEEQLYQMDEELLEEEEAKRKPTFQRQNLSAPRSS
jgi:ferritin